MEVDHLVDLFLREGVAAPAMLDIAVDDGVFAGTALRTACLVDGDDLCALFRSRTNCGHTGDAAANDEDIRADLFLNVCVGNLRGFAQPVVLGSRSFRRFSRRRGSRALCLRNAVVCRGADRVAGDGCAGDGIHVTRLSRQNGILHGFADRAADARRLPGDIDHDVGNAGLVEGHRDGDFALKAHCFCGIGAGGVLCGLFGGSHSQSAGSQHACGGKAECACCGSFQKVSAGNQFCHDASS